MTGGRLAIGPVEYESRPVGVDKSLSCVTLGLYLLFSPDGPAAILIHGDAERGPRSPDVIVDVIAANAGHAEVVLADLRRRARELNVYRRQMFSLGPGANPFGQNSLGVTFHPRPQVGREDIVLPADVLERVERHILDIGRSRELLLRAGRHLKRGLLLHGPPGVGKTLTVRYLATEMADATIIVLSGAAIGAITTSCTMARELAPSVVVVEDVDLIAQDRSMPGQHGQPLLFQLMNEIEGIADDADVAFILTTNRAEVLEPALAARPGRVDLAISLERPDAAARQQLIDLYGRGLELDVSDWSEFIARTDGVTPAFIKEWLRSAVLRARDPGGLGRDELESALDELLGEANALTRVLLGGAVERAAEAGVRFPGADRLPSHLGWMPGAASARREIDND